MAKFSRHGYSAGGKPRPEYWSWHNAKRRCSEVSNSHYHRYGGRGITMCPEWYNDFSAFIAHIGPKPDGTTLDRIDNNKGYEPGNVRWTTPSIQAFNRNPYPPRKPKPRTTCKHGHPWVPENLYFFTTGKKPVCKTCHREQWKKSKSRHLLDSSP
jgi:hypothetical protein